MKSCPLCNKEMKTLAAMGRHTHHFHKDALPTKKDRMYTGLSLWYGKELIDSITEQYINEELCIHDITKMGIDIGSYFKELGIKRTSKEERKTSRYQEKYTSSIVEKYGVENISQAKEVKMKKKETFTETHGTYENYIEHKKTQLTAGYTEYINNINWEEETERRKENLILKYGVENVSQIPEVRVKISETKKSNISNKTIEERRTMTEICRTHVSHRGGFRSKLEERFEALLKELNIPYETNKMIFGYNYDFVLKGNIVFEIQGDMWHGNPKLYKSGDVVFSGRLLVDDLWEKDNRKRVACVENDIDLHVLWEYDMKRMSDKDIKDFITSIY